MKFFNFMKHIALRSYRRMIIKMKQFKVNLVFYVTV